MSTQCFLKITLLGLLMTILVISSAQAVVLKQKNKIEDEFLRLGHVFDGVTENADYILAPAPIPGETTVLNAYSLNQIATAFGLAWSAPNAYVQASIERAATIIDNSILQDVIMAHLEKNFELGTFKIELANRHQTIAMSSEYAPIPEIQQLSLDARRGQFYAKIDAPDGQTIDVVGRIIKLTMVPVLSKTISNGDVIAKQDIQWIEVDENQLSSNMIIDSKQLIGMTPRRMITALSLVRDNQLETPLSILKGDTVSVTLNTGKIQLYTKARALNSGAIGDSIRIMNLKSNRVIDAIITGAQTVEVETAINAGL